MSTMAGPSELSLIEIRDFMLKNGGKVTNLELVKYFKKFLTNPTTQDESRKQFKTYVNTLSTIKNEGKEKYIVLRKKYFNECPSEDDGLESLGRSEYLMSPGSRSTISEHENLSFSGSQSFLSDVVLTDSPYKDPPPYKPPPEVKFVSMASDTKDQYKECVDEFKTALEAFGGSSRDNSLQCKDNREFVDKNKENEKDIPIVPPRKRSTCDKMSVDSVDDHDANKENTERNIRANTLEKQISVKEAMQKFNQIASEEEAKITSPPSKKKPEKKAEDLSNDNLLSSHPKSKEWIVSAARANYQELAKLASEYPELVKLQDPTTGYTALHWAAKHGNEDIVKLIAGTHKANANARTNGGYTPLHLAMQFGKDNIFELLCNVYKADRDILDWSGKKALDYRKIRTTVSASTYSSEYKHAIGIDSSTLPYGNKGGRRKHKRNKRFATSTGVIYRTQSFLGFPKTPEPEDSPINPNRCTAFSPELGDGKRAEKKPFLFRKKSLVDKRNESEA